MLVPSAPNPEKERDSWCAAAIRARMTNQDHIRLFLSFPRVAAAHGGSCRPECSEGTTVPPRPFTSFRAAAAAVRILLSVP
jgi:hypothetical protein